MIYHKKSHDNEHFSLRILLIGTVMYFLGDWKSILPYIFSMFIFNGSAA